MTNVCVWSGNKDFTDFCVASLMYSNKVFIISKLEEIEQKTSCSPLIFIVDNETCQIPAEVSLRLQEQSVYILVMMKTQKIENIVNSIKNGVHEVLEYPCSSIKLFKCIENIKTCIMSKVKQNIFEGMELKLQEGCEKADDILQRFAKTDLPILLLGETGTGKSFCAKKIVSKSHRKDKTFVQVNCSAIPEQLAELELFGSEKGAFTGAENMIGYLERAHEGTLFLDEIGELPCTVQAKLLKVFDEGEFYKLGSTRPKKVNIRYLFATNRDLKVSILEGKFRKDFFNRINTVQFYLPALKEQKQNIDYYINIFSDEIGKSIDTDLRRVLNNYEWPGNIRELKNLLNKISHFSIGNEIRLQDLDCFSLIGV